MKNLFFKILMISGVLMSESSLMAQATPGNAGANPGTSNGGSGIQTQPNPNPNPNPTGATGYMGATGYTGSGTTQGTSGTTGTTTPKRTKGKTPPAQDPFRPQNPTDPK